MSSTTVSEMPMVTVKMEPEFLIAALGAIAAASQQYPADKSFSATERRRRLNGAYSAMQAAADAYGDELRAMRKEASKV